MAAWPSSAKQVGFLCIFLPLHGFNYHLLAPLFYMAIPSKLHFTPYGSWIVHLTNPLFHFCSNHGVRYTPYVGMTLVSQATPFAACKIETRDDPERNGGHIKSAQMTRSKCLH